MKLGFLKPFLLGILILVRLDVRAESIAKPSASQETCLDCHREKDLAKNLPGGKKLTLFVDEKIAKSSVHGSLLCADCHADLKPEHPDNRLASAPVDCARCHEEQSARYKKSIHGSSRINGGQDSATCTSCHGKHDMLSATNPNSPVFKLNLSRTCAKCHDNKGLTKEYKMRYPNVASQYQDSIHVT